MSAKRSIARTLAVLSILVSLSLQPEWVAAQMIILPQPANLRLVTVDVDVTFDPNVGLFTSTYKVTSAPSTAQNVWFVALEIGEVITDAASPPGWAR